MSSPLDLLDTTIGDHEPVTGFNTISDFTGFGLNLLMGVAFFVSFTMIAYSGVMYVLSRGDPKLTTKAWNTFLWGAIACAITLGAVVIKGAIFQLFGATSV